MVLKKKKNKNVRKKTLHIFSNGEKHRKGTMKVAIKKGNLKLVSPEILAYISQQQHYRSS